VRAKQFTTNSNILKISKNKNKTKQMNKIENKQKINKKQKYYKNKEKHTKFASKARDQKRICHNA